MAVTSMTWWPVAPALADRVDAIYVLRTDGAPSEELAGALLPQLHWPLAGRFAWQARDGQVQWFDAPAAFGPSTAALHFRTEGPAVVVGTGLFPEGWASLMPMTAGAVLERVIDLAALWGADAHAPIALDPAADDPHLAAALEALLLRRLADAPPLDARIVAISRWANGADHDIAALAAELGLSERQVERLSVAAHGLPPRLLANKHKILRMAAVLSLGERDNRRETWTSEYADQSHFNRNFARFVGVSPTRFLAAPEVFVRGVMRARLAIASAHPLGLDPAARAPSGLGERAEAGA